MIEMLFIVVVNDWTCNGFFIMRLFLFQIQKIYEFYIYLFLERISDADSCLLLCFKRSRPWVRVRYLCLLVDTAFVNRWQGVSPQPRTVLSVVYNANMKLKMSPRGTMLRQESRQHAENVFSKMCMQIVDCLQVTSPNSVRSSVAYLNPLVPF